MKRTITVHPIQSAPDPSENWSIAATARAVLFLFHHSISPLATLVCPSRETNMTRYDTVKR
jgi:hypothetical protein